MKIRNKKKNTKINNVAFLITSQHHSTSSAKLVELDKLPPYNSVQDKWCISSGPVANTDEKDSPVPFNFIESERRQYLLSRTIFADVRVEDGLFFYASEHPSIYGHGFSGSEAKQDFISCFHVIYKNYVECDEEKLDASGLELRRQLQDLVSEII